MTESKRDAFFFSNSNTDGITLRKDGIFQYYETIPGLRRYLPLPGGIHWSMWETLITLRNEEDGWKEVEDCDDVGEIYCRRGDYVFLLTSFSTLRVLLNLVLDTVQLKDRVILFQLTYHNEKKEWGYLFVSDTTVRRYECDSVGNTMHQKWKNTTLVRNLDPNLLLSLVKQAESQSNISETASNFTRGDEGILVSYVTNNAFIINTKGSLHPLYDRIVKLSQKEVL